MGTLLEDMQPCPRTRYLLDQVIKLTNAETGKITNTRMQLISDDGKTKWIELTDGQVAQIFINLCNAAEFEHEAVK